MQKPNTKNRVREQWTTNELENYTTGANTKRTNASNIYKSMRFLALTPPVAWQAFPFGFGEKKDRGTTRKGIFGFGRAKNGTGAKKWNGGGGGEGKEGNASRQTPGFWKPARKRAGRLIGLLGLASWILLRCVDQKFVSYWDVVTRIIFCGYCLFWLACSMLRDGGRSRSVKRNAKNARGLGRDTAVTAYFSKSRSSYFRFARFNTPHHLRERHRLILVGNICLLMLELFLWPLLKRKALLSVK